MVTPYDNNADLVIHSSLGEVFSRIKIWSIEFIIEI
jgi:hypothetical protein